MERIEKSKAEFMRWCDYIGVRSASDINRLVDAGKISELVNMSETRHAQLLSEAALMIKERGSRVIFIAGPSSSGKTTAAIRLTLHLKALGITAVSVSLDDYYIEKERMPKNAEGEPDFEALASIDYKRFNENLADLISGREAIMPDYSFTSQKPVPSAKSLRLSDDEVIIAEGIHGLNPALADNIADERKFRLYVTALSGLADADGVKIPSATLRMIRRLIRDYYFRSTDYSETFDLWPNQESSAQKNIYPYTDTADMIFNSSLLYELGVYRSHLLRLLTDAPQNGGDAELIRALRATAEGFRSIDEALVPSFSLAREFIGGGTLNYD